MKRKENNPKRAILPMKIVIVSACEIKTKMYRGYAGKVEKTMIEST